MDAVMMFKVLVPHSFYGLSDARAEFQIMDRRSIGRFLGISAHVIHRDAVAPRQHLHQALAPGLPHRQFRAANEARSAKPGQRAGVLKQTGLQQRRSRDAFRIVPHHPLHCAE